MNKSHMVSLQELRDYKEWRQAQDIIIKGIYIHCLTGKKDAIDGGAHVGFHSTGMARCLTRGRVLAIEPNP